MEKLRNFILEAAYEATLWEGVISASAGGSKIVLLTLVGGGAFGNREEWIITAIRYALQKVCDFPLDVKIVSYGEPTTSLRNFISSCTFAN